MHLFKQVLYRQELVCSVMLWLTTLPVCTILSVPHGKFCVVTPIRAPFRHCLSSKSGVKRISMLGAGMMHVS